MTQGKDRSGNELPDRIDTYKILDILGEGGMSIVYLAEQQEPVRRQVALKILKPGMDTRQIIARFESERQALAVLDYPGIADIYDGGVTEQGLPYFAMERVNGVPINEYCDENRLTMRERVAVFVDVCSAVQHAHHKGLIHRDLKPSNILVGVSDGRPLVKVIDFGIAKATGVSLTDKTLFTKVGQLIGTPQYMSPEQADSSGLDVDTRADIYSLGVIFYELLVGAVPLELAQVADHAVRHAIREKDPPKPSTRITELGDTASEVAKARQADLLDIRKELAGDLDWIVMKAIEKDRTRRYETANALAMECRRYLRHEPVLARAPSSAYLLGRFIRRNRIVVAWAGIAIAAVVAGAVATTIGMVKARKAEQVALTEAETASAVSDFLVGLFYASDPFASSEDANAVSAKDLVDRGAQRLETELQESPTVRARLMNALGVILTNLGEIDRAEELIHDAMAIRRESMDANAREFAESYYALGQIAYNKGDYLASVDAFERAIELFAEADGAESAAVADTLRYVASSYSQLSQSDRAIAALRRSSEILRALPDTPDSQIGENINSLGLTLYLAGDHVEAALAFEEALGYLSGSPPTGLYARTLSNLAIAYQLTGRIQESIETQERALEIKRDVFGPRHIEVAYSLNALGNIERELGEFGDASTLLAETIDIFSSALGEEHGNVAIVKLSLAHVMLDSGRLEEARNLFTEARPIVVSVFGEGSLREIQTLNGIGFTALSEGNVSEANALFSEAVEKGRTIATSSVDLGLSLTGFAASVSSDDPEFDRHALFEEAIEMLAATAGRESVRTLDARRWYARFLKENGELPRARREFAGLLESLGNTLGNDNATYRQYETEYHDSFNQ